MKLSLVALLSSLLYTQTTAFSILPHTPSNVGSSTQLYHGHPGGHPKGAATMEPPTGFIATELRSAAMKLHTTAQAPKEGGVKVEKPKERYITKHMDYLKFLVDSQHVYQAFEEIMAMEELQPELAPFVNTGLERGDRLEKDIEFMVEEYGLERPSVGGVGTRYALEIREMAKGGKENIPQLMNHYYNHYFAHTAGGIMIGKQMAKLLLDGKTLEFYKVRRKSRIRWELDVGESWGYENGF